MKGGKKSHTLHENVRGIALVIYSTKRSAKIFDLIGSSCVLLFLEYVKVGVCDIRADP